MPRPSSSWTRKPSESSDFAPLGPTLTLLLDQLIQARATGTPISAALLIENHPDLNSEEAVQLIYEEISLKRDDGETVDSQEVLNQFPQYHNQLLTLLEFEKLLDSPRPEPDFPEPGTTVGPFFLIRRLGRGAAGRTYLAQEKSLGDRLVVVKIMPKDQEEHLTLARLQHTHIMPLFSELSLPDNGLRLLCMPYLGGAGLHEILAGLKEKGILKCNGRTFLSVLETLSGPDFNRAGLSSPSRQLFATSSYADTIASIGASIAEAAHEAHARGLVHMDIKPSNILISADAEPLLLDFHLARKPVRQGELRVERLGGTRGWMSPEQKQCFEAATQGRPMPCPIDGRSDQYSIGLLMADALNCKSTEERSLPAFGPDVSAGLADIIRRCLVQNPADRYPTAAALADDLRRHLASLPLKGVKNRSLTERWQKWKKRNPAGPVWFFAALLIMPLLAYAGFEGLQSRGRVLQEAAEDINDSRRWIDSGNYDLAMQRLNATRIKIANIPSTSYYNRLLEINLAQARRLKLASQLNFVMDRIRFQYGPADLAEAAWEKLKQQCLSLWQRRQELALDDTQNDTDFNARLNKQIKADLIELAVILADLSARDPNTEAAVNARTIISDAEKEFGPDFSLTLARNSMASSPGSSATNSAAGPELRPDNAREFHQLGQSLARHKRMDEARPAYDRAAQLQPDQFWFQYDLAVCLHQLKRFDEALAAWSSAIALRPQSAVCRYNRGITWEALHQPEKALSDFQQATSLEPSLADGWFRTGLLFHASGKKPEALSAILKAAELGSVEAAKWLRSTAR